MAAERFLKAAVPQVERSVKGAGMGGYVSWVRGCVVHRHMVVLPLFTICTLDAQARCMTRSCTSHIGLPALYVVLYPYCTCKWCVWRAHVTLCCQLPL